MASIEIPEVETLGGVGDPCEHIVAIFHFMLTALLKQEQALLHAEYRRPAEESAWYLRRRVGGEEGDDETLAVLPSAILQSCAARLALALDLSHITGGYARVQMTQNGRKHDCSVYVSNCKQSGCWIRVYGRAV